MWCRDRWPHTGSSQGPRLRALTRLERLPQRSNVRWIDATLLPPSDEVMARDTLETGLDVQPALGCLTDGELAAGRARGDRIPVAPITEQAVLAAPTGGDHREVVGPDGHWPQRLLGQPDSGDFMGGAMHPHLGHLRQPAPKRLMQRIKRRNIWTGRPKIATDRCDPTVHLPRGLGSVWTAQLGHKAVMISKVQIAGVPPMGATGVMPMHHRFLMVMEQVLRPPPRDAKACM